jgi:predicted transcriptional regulator
VKIAFTDRELDVMAVLWAGGSATVADVRQRLADKLAHPTVLTVLRTLEEKGYLGHAGEGRAYRYRPLVNCAAAGKTALRRLLDLMVQGSPIAAHPARFRSRLGQAGTAEHSTDARGATPEETP